MNHQPELKFMRAGNTMVLLLMNNCSLQQSIIKKLVLHIIFAMLCDVVGNGGVGAVFRDDVAKIFYVGLREKISTSKTPHSSRQVEKADSKIF